MKTLLFDNGTEKVSVKVDIFATNAELESPGFDARFTAMQVEDEEAAIKAGLSFSQNEYNYRAMVQKAQDNGWALIVSDINDKGESIIAYDGLLPTAPTNLVASNVTASSVDLSWTASQDNVEVVGYKVYQDDVEIEEVAGTSTSVSGLTSSTTYNFKVTAIDAEGNESAPSNVESTTTAV